MHPLLSELISQIEGPCISLYIQVLPGVSHAGENEKRLETALRACETRLHGYELSEKGRSQFLAPARAYAEEHLRCGVHGKTLALFFSPSFFSAYVLSESVDPCTVIGSTFRITPLLSRLQDGRHYYVLAVSKKHAHLLEVSDGEASFKDVAGMPASFEDAWKGTEHSFGDHHDSSKDDGEMELKVYLNLISKSLHTLLHEQHSPLIFAGVEELHGLYQHMDTSGKLLHEYIRGNPDRMEAKEILEKAEPIVRTAIAAEHRKLLDSYGPLTGTGRTSTDLSMILGSAQAGKVELLFVAEGAHEWGTFAPETGAQTLHESQTDKSEDLLSTAAVLTLRHRGRVVVVPKDEMPEKKEIAAILRY